MGRIKERDLENLATVRREKIPYLVPYDEDYMQADVGEYVTPKDFVELFGMRPYEMEY